MTQPKPRIASFLIEVVLFSELLLHRQRRGRGVSSTSNSFSFSSCHCKLLYPWLFKKESFSYLHSAYDMALLLGVQVAFHLVSVADESCMSFSLLLHAHMEEEEEPKSKQNQQGQETKHQPPADSAPRLLEGDLLSCHLSAAPFFLPELIISLRALMKKQNIL